MAFNFKNSPFYKYVGSPVKSGLSDFKRGLSTIPKLLGIGVSTVEAPIESGVRNILGGESFGEAFRTSLGQRLANAISSQNQPSNQTNKLPVPANFVGPLKSEIVPNLTNSQPIGGNINNPYALSATGSAFGSNNILDILPNAGQTFTLGNQRVFFGGATPNDVTVLSEGRPLIENVKLDANPTLDSAVLKEQPTTNLDIKSLIDANQKKIDTILQPIIDYYANPITPDIQAAKKEFDTLQEQINQEKVNAQEDITNLGKQPILSAVARIQQGDRETLANQKLAQLGIRQQAAARRLQDANATQQQKLQAAEFLYNATKNNLNDILNLYKATAPENLGTQVNQATGDVFVITKNPLTGQVSTVKAGNVGAQKSFVSTSIQQDADGNYVLFGVLPNGDVDVVPLGVLGAPKTSALIKVATPYGNEVLYNPATGQTIDPLSGGSFNLQGSPLPGFGGTVNPQTGESWRTDRNNNPIAAAVTMGGSNEFTKALDKAGIPWTYGDAFPENPNMRTIKILGNPVEGARAILSGSNAIQNWYLNHTGKDILSQYGVSTNTDFSLLPKPAQDAIIAGIYRNEGGSGQLLKTNSNLDPSNLWQSALTIEYKNPDDRKFSLATISSYLNSGQYDKAQKFIEKKATQQLPVQQQENLENFSTVSQLIDKLLAYNSDGKLEGIGPFWLGSIKGALSQIGLGGEEGRQVRALIGNIKATIARMRGGTSFTVNEERLLDQYTPTINDSGAVAISKLNLLKDFIETKKNAALTNAGVIMPNTLTQQNIQALREKYGY